MDATQRASRASKTRTDERVFLDEEGRCLTPFADILAYYAERAKEALPGVNGRVEKALEIALDARNVIVDLDYTTFYIASHGGGWYTVTGDGCECKDYRFGGGRPCKHMIARWLVIRAQQADGTRPSNKEDCDPQVELEAQVEAEEREYLTRFDGYEFDGYDPADAEFDRWARFEAAAEYVEMAALEEMERWAEGEREQYPTRSL